MNFDLHYVEVGNSVSALHNSKNKLHVLLVLCGISIWSVVGL